MTASHTKFKARDPASTWVGVTGAAGWIGQQVCGCLERSGAQVRRFGRGGGDKEFRRLDLAEASVSDWSDALQGCTTVVHCAAHVHRSHETAGERELFHIVNVEGTERLLQACRHAHVRRFVFASSMAVYAWDGGAGPRSESARLALDSAYGGSKLLGENLVRQSGLCWRIARLGTVYGTGDRANFMRLAQALRRRRFVLPGAGATRKSVLPVDMAGELLCRLALLPGDDPLTVNCAAPSTPSLAEICAGFAKACGFPQPPHVPVVLLRLGAYCGDLGARLGITLPLTGDVLSKLTTDTEVDVEKMQSLFPDLSWQDFGASLVSSARYYCMHDL